MRSAIKPLVLLLAVLSLGSVVLAQDDQMPPHELKSPGKHYSVRILDTALPGFDNPYGGDIYTVAVYRGEKCLSKFPTIGYLEEAFWSSDGKYVAVNNRRANSGDYLWVFRLNDGRAIKTPVDVDPTNPAAPSGNYYEQFEHKLVGYVSAVYPKETEDAFRKDFTFATKWIERDKLIVENDLQFNNLEDRVVQMIETYRISRSKMVLVSRKFQERPRGKSEF